MYAEYIYTDVTTRLKFNGRSFLKAFVILNKVYILIHLDFLVNELASVSFLNYFTRGLGILRIHTIFNKDYNQFIHIELISAVQ
jgi:hypothetical protein